MTVKTPCAQHADSEEDAQNEAVAEVASENIARERVGIRGSFGTVIISFPADRSLMRRWLKKHAARVRGWVRNG
jgi:hypothetical protein